MEANKIVGNKKIQLRCIGCCWYEGWAGGERVDERTAAVVAVVVVIVVQ